MKIKNGKTVNKDDKNVKGIQVTDNFCTGKVHYGRETAPIHNRNNQKGCNNAKKQELKREFTGK